MSATYQYTKTVSILVTLNSKQKYMLINLSYDFIIYWKFWKIIFEIYVLYEDPNIASIQSGFVCVKCIC